MVITRRQSATLKTSNSVSHVELNGIAAPSCSKSLPDGERCSQEDNEETSTSAESLPTTTPRRSSRSISISEKEQTMARSISYSGYDPRPQTQGVRAKTPSSPLCVAGLTSPLSIFEKALSLAHQRNHKSDADAAIEKDGHDQRACDSPTATSHTDTVSERPTPSLSNSPSKKHSRRPKSKWLEHLISPESSRESSPVISSSSSKSHSPVESMNRIVTNLQSAAGECSSITPESDQVMVIPTVEAVTTQRPRGRPRSLRNSTSRNQSQINDLSSALEILQNLRNSSYITSIPATLKNHIDKALKEAADCFESIGAAPVHDDVSVYDLSAVMKTPTQSTPGKINEGERFRTPSSRPQRTPTISTPLSTRSMSRRMATQEAKRDQPEWFLSLNTTSLVKVRGTASFLDRYLELKHGQQAQNTSFTTRQDLDKLRTDFDNDVAQMQKEEKISFVPEALVYSYFAAKKPHVVCIPSFVTQEERDYPSMLALGERFSKTQTYEAIGCFVEIDGFFSIIVTNMLSTEARVLGIAKHTHPDVQKVRNVIKALNGANNINVRNNFTSANGGDPGQREVVWAADKWFGARKRFGEEHENMLERMLDYLTANRDEVLFHYMQFCEAKAFAEASSYISIGNESLGSSSLNQSMMSVSTFYDDEDGGPFLAEKDLFTYLCLSYPDAVVVPSQAFRGDLSKSLNPNVCRLPENGSRELCILLLYGSANIEIGICKDRHLTIIANKRVDKLHRDQLRVASELLTNDIVTVSTDWKRMRYKLDQNTLGRRVIFGVLGFLRDPAFEYSSRRGRSDFLRAIYGKIQENQGLVTELNKKFDSLPELEIDLPDFSFGIPSNEDEPAEPVVQAPALTFLSESDLFAYLVLTYPHATIVPSYALQTENLDKTINSRTCHFPTKSKEKLWIILAQVDDQVQIGVFKKAALTIFGRMSEDHVMAYRMVAAVSTLGEKKVAVSRRKLPTADNVRNKWEIFFAMRHIENNDHLPRPKKNSPWERSFLNHITSVFKNNKKGKEKALRQYESGKEAIPNVIDEDDDIQILEEFLEDTQHLNFPTTKFDDSDDEDFNFNLMEIFESEENQEHKERAFETIGDIMGDDFVPVPGRMHIYEDERGVERVSMNPSVVPTTPRTTDQVPEETKNMWTSLAKKEDVAGIQKTISEPERNSASLSIAEIVTKATFTLKERVQSCSAVRKQRRVERVFFSCSAPEKQEVNKVKKQEIVIGRKRNASMCPSSQDLLKSPKRFRRESRSPLLSSSMEEHKETLSKVQNADTKEQTVAYTRAWKTTTEATELSAQVNSEKTEQDTADGAESLPSSSKRKRKAMESKDINENQDVVLCEDPQPGTPNAAEKPAKRRKRNDSLVQYLEKNLERLSQGKANGSEPYSVFNSHWARKLKLIKTVNLTEEDLPESKPQRKLNAFLQLGLVQKFNYLEERKSIFGKGVFATEPIKADRYVVDYPCRAMSSEEFSRMYEVVSEKKRKKIDRQRMHFDIPEKAIDYVFCALDVDDKKKRPLWNGEPVKFYGHRLNHSSKHPNVKPVVKHRVDDDGNRVAIVIFRSLRDIKKGEELLWDYTADGVSPHLENKPWLLWCPCRKCEGKCWCDLCKGKELHLAVVY
ncbi:hypothetical protein QR680_013783 [Steinernema hermaphroditum]|uniref:SET domain-containing protein n=1 Tax=Steinernema hermaphroditum TaxID=289476 RepID=A0AA39I6N2_9BILA|nr:hypothetical protein QR680_013783 [Steinernema hermaphroditum]